jgi:hypothetical protein
VDSELENPGLERVRFELRASGVRDQSKPVVSGIHSRGYLPHVKRKNSDYFITFRLGDSLPKEVLLKIARERAEKARSLSSPLQREV